MTRTIAVAATTAVFALTGAGTALACDGTGGTGGTYPGGDYPTSSSTTTTSSSTSTTASTTRKAHRHARRAFRS